MKKLLIVLTFTCISLKIFAQDSLVKEHDLILKFMPLTLADVDNTLEFSIEKMLKNRWSIEGTAGYGGLNSNIWIHNQKAGDKSYYYETFRAKLEFKHYRKPTDVLQKNNKYTSAELFYKHNETAFMEVLGHDCGNNFGGVSTVNCAYLENKRSQFKKNVVGLRAKFGIVYHFYNFEKNRLSTSSFEIYGGFGVRYIWSYRVEANTLDTNSIYQSDRFFGTRAFNDLRGLGNYFSIDTQLGIKFGFMVN